MIALALALGACRSVPPAHDASDDKTAPAELEPGHQAELSVVERTMAVEVMGQTLGVVEMQLEKAPDGTWTSREHVTFALTRQGGGEDAQFASTTESVSVYDPEREFVSGVEIEREAGITITRTVSLEEGVFVSSYSGPGRDNEVKRFPAPSDYRSDLAVDFELVAEWERTGEPATRSYRSFDLERERFELVEVTILGETEFVHGDQVIPAYRFRTTEEDGTVIDTLVDHDMLPLSMDAGGTFIATWVDEAPAIGADGGGKIDSELPVSGKTHTRWWELARQEVTVTVDDHDAETPALWEDNHYHRVERSGARYEIELLSTRPAKEFEPPQLPMTLEEPEIARYLEPTAMAQSDAPMITAAAREIVGPETNSLTAAELIVAAVFHGIAKEAGVRGSATATEVLQNAAGDCTEHAVLVVALMRAVGIPARVVDGIVIAADADGAGVAGYHAWAEIWLGQWIGVDATVNETGTSARYLQFGIDEPGSVGSGGKMMRSIGKTKIELGAHELYED